MGKEKNWTSEEVQYLKDNYGELSLKAIAKNLNRSLSGVINKKVRLKLGAFLDKGDYITLSQLLMAVYGIDSRASAYRYSNSQLWQTLPIHKQRVGNCSFRVVRLTEFWEWAEINKSKLNFTKLQRNVLGVEPEWVTIKRALDAKLKFKTTPWTRSEDVRLERLLAERRYTYTDLCRLLNRTSGAIRRRIYDLALDDTRLVRKKTVMWTDEEVQKLVFLFDEGHSPEAIAEQLGRSGHSVRYKLESLANPGMHKRENRRKRA